MLLNRPRPIIVAECASNHGGDLRIAERMVNEALNAGADLIKFQAYDPKRLSSWDSQARWLTGAALSLNQVQMMEKVYPNRLLWSVFDLDRLAMLRDMGVTRFKVGHADRWKFEQAEKRKHEQWYASYAWGRDNPADWHWTSLSVLPLYPAPLSALSAIQAGCRGYSDHTIGLDACQIMLARGATVIEKHFSIDGCPRRQEWDMDVDGLKSLVAWSKVCCEAQAGTAQTERWA